DCFAKNRSFRRLSTCCTDRLESTLRRGCSSCDGLFVFRGSRSLPAMPPRTRALNPQSPVGSTWWNGGCQSELDLLDVIDVVGLVGQQPGNIFPRGPEPRHHQTAFAVPRLFHHVLLNELAGVVP